MRGFNVERMNEGAVGTGCGDALAVMLRTLGEMDPADEDAARVDQIRQLEQVKSAVAALQARVTSAFVVSQRETNLAAGVAPERAERGVASQVGLARRCSPFRARRYVGWARILTTELPETFAALESGETTEQWGSPRQ